MSDTPLDPNTPAPGSASDINDALRRIIGTQLMQEQAARQKSVLADQAIAAAPANQGTNAVPTPAAGVPTGPTAEDQLRQSSPEGGPGGVFPIFRQVLAETAGGMSSLQTQIPIVALIGQWKTSAPAYSGKLQSLMQYARMATMQWDSLASEPGAAPDMAAPLQALGDNMDAWTVAGLMSFQNQAQALFQQE
jgi:hypothetical protein